jgi:hypothetical protein
LYGQGIEPVQLQPSLIKDGILRAKIKVYDDFTQDTVYYYQHDSLIINPDSIYLRNDTIFLKDGSGFVKVTSGTVTSVGLTTGTTGTDINVTGSPITGAGVFNLNIPTASATNRGALSSADWSIFNGKVGGSGAANRLPFFINTNNIIIPFKFVNRREGDVPIIYANSNKSNKLFINILQTVVTSKFSCVIFCKTKPFSKTNKPSIKFID